MTAVRTSNRGPLSERRRRSAPRCAGLPAPGVVEALMHQAADGDGLICPDVRALAAASPATTSAVRSIIRQLVDEGRLTAVGRGVHALPGARGANLALDEAPAMAARAPAHRQIHEASGSTVLW